MGNQGGGLGEEDLRGLEPILEHTAEAFNRGDFEQAFAFLPDAIEWHLPPELPDAGVLRSPRDIIDFYRRLRAVFPDWHSEERDYSLVGERTIVIHHRMSGTGGFSGAGVGTEVIQILELDQNGIPARVHEFLDREQADRHLDAAR